MSTVDYKTLFESKCQEFDQLKAEFNEHKELANELEAELEADNKQLEKDNAELKKENEKLRKELLAMKERGEKTSNSSKQLEASLEKLETENKRLKEEIKAKSRHIIQLEIETEQLNHQCRESDLIISDLESKIDKTLEKLTIVQLELDENRAQSEEQIERLRQKLRESESEVFAFRKSAADLSTTLKNSALPTTQSLSLARVEENSPKATQTQTTKPAISQSVSITTPSENNSTLQDITSQFNKIDENNTNCSSTKPKDKQETENSKSHKKKETSSRMSIEELAKLNNSGWRDMFSFSKPPKTGNAAVTSTQVVNNATTTTTAVQDENAKPSGFKKSLGIVNTLIKDLNSRLTRKASNKKTSVPFAYIAQIAEDSPAQKAGLKVNDMLVEIADVSADNKEGLNSLSKLLKESAGKEVRVRVLRKYNTTQSIDKDAIKLVNYNQENHQILDLAIVPQAKGYLGCKILSISD